MRADFSLPSASGIEAKAGDAHPAVRLALSGGAGNDTLISRDGTSDFLSGGLGTDKAKKDSQDTTIGVEVLLA